jgi:hypothetical protein
MEPKRPSFVPALNLDGLPEYVTSSEEDQASEKEVLETPM